jgi:hypothetical protein
LNDYGFQIEAGDGHLADYFAFGYGAGAWGWLHFGEFEFFDGFEGLRVHYYVGDVAEAQNAYRQEKIIGCVKKQGSRSLRPACDGVTRDHFTPLADWADGGFSSAAE